MKKTFVFYCSILLGLLLSPNKSWSFSQSDLEAHSSALAHSGTCDRIGDSDLRDHCYAMISKITCAGIGHSDLRNHCTALKSGGRCSDIMDSDLQKHCFALKHGASCSEISDWALREHCSSMARHVLISTSMPSEENAFVAYRKHGGGLIYEGSPGYGYGYGYGDGHGCGGLFVTHPPYSDPNSYTLLRARASLSILEAADVAARNGGRREQPKPAEAWSAARCMQEAFRKWEEEVKRVSPILRLLSNIKELSEESRYWRRHIAHLIVAEGSLFSGMDYSKTRELKAYIHSDCELPLDQTLTPEHLRDLIVYLEKISKVTY